MVYRTKAIVLSLIKYSENKLILHLLTADSGRQSYLTYASRRNNTRRNIFQPLQVIEFKAQKTRHSELPLLSDAIVLYPLISISTDPRKSTIAMFIGELLYRLIVEPVDDAKMYDFIEQSILALEEMEEGTANFHLWFLIRFAARMGWALPADYEEEMWLDIRNGIYTHIPPITPERIAPELSKTINTIRLSSLEDLSSVQLSQLTRRQILEALIEYYRFHSESFREMKSISIFRDLF